MKIIKENDIMDIYIKQFYRKFNIVDLLILIVI